MKNVGELIEKLNAAVSSPDFMAELKKIHDHSDFHDLVRKHVVPLLPASVKVGTWRLFFPSLPFDQKFVSYTRAFVPYKNSSRGDKGNFSNVSFIIESGWISSFHTLDEAIERLKATYYHKRIDELTQAIQTRTEEIAEYGKHIAAFRADLDKLNLT
jgi:hypothetical protein